MQHPLFDPKSRAISNHARRLCSKKELRKTEMCSNYPGQCPHGAGCWYAHAPWELRPKVVSTKHRTRPCLNHALGYCRYGHRCWFQHHNPGRQCGTDADADAVAAESMLAHLLI